MGAGRTTGFKKKFLKRLNSNTIRRCFGCDVFWERWHVEFTVCMLPIVTVLAFRHGMTQMISSISWQESKQVYSQKCQTVPRRNINSYNHHSVVAEKCESVLRCDLSPHTDPVRRPCPTLSYPSTFGTGYFTPCSRLI